MNEMKHGDTEKIDANLITEPTYNPDEWLDFSDKFKKTCIGKKDFDPDEWMTINEDTTKMHDLSIVIEYFPCRNEGLANDMHPITGVPFEKKIITVDGRAFEVVVPIFDSKFDAKLPNDKLKASDADQFMECNKQLKEAIENDQDLREQFTPEQLEQIKNGDTPDGYTWHHDAEVGKMQLVDTRTHQLTGHTGGKVIWGGGSENR